MKPRNEFKKGRNLIDEYKKILDPIDKAIKELEEKKQELEKRLINKDSYKLEDIEKNREINIEMSYIDSAIKQAQKDKANKLQSISAKSIENAQKAIIDYDKEIQSSYNEISRDISLKVLEIRGLYKLLRQYQALEMQQVTNFITDLTPYVDDIEEFKGTVTANERIQQLQGDIRHLNYLFVVKGESFGIEGLEKPKEVHDPTAATASQIWEAFKITNEDVKRIELEHLKQYSKE